MTVYTCRNLLCLIMSVYVLNANAQCGTPISTFPYVEDFETSAAWTTGGPACTPLNLVINDWVWGHPQKNVISSAGSGQRCWIVGDSVGWFYAYGERSWVKSPCFDFTSLQRPYIQFKIFWESEYKYDGANLQYSLDGGTTWTDVGSSTGPTDCMDTNWYNYNDITHLGSYNGPLPGHGNTSQSYKSLCIGTSTNGWCGNIQASYHDTSGVSGSTCQGGHGSGQWLTAKHCMPYLTGQSSVVFRFTFGAGTGCNNFNGFAFDSVAIGEGAPNTSDFTYSCGSVNTVNFSGITTLCPDTFQWNFGDPASGSTNTILGAGNLNPSHTFSGPGTYNVTFTVKGGPCNAPGSVVKTIKVISATPTGIDVSCPGRNDGSAYVTASGASSYTYAWSTNPAQTTDTISGLSAGTYTVTVSASGVCPAIASVTIAASNPLSHTVLTSPSSCGNNNGSIVVHESGGTPNYIFTWSTTAIGDSLTSLSPGAYTLTVTDQKGCRDSLTASVASATYLAVTIDSANISCHGKNDGHAIAISNGIAPIQYAWSNAATTDTISALSAGTYTVTVKDASNCTGLATVVIINPDSFYAISSLVADSCAAAAGRISVSVSGGTAPYRYLWTPTQANIPQISSLTAGSYTLIITDANGCSLNEVYVIGDTCIIDSLVFPSAFSPNGDGKNETFGPVYTGSVTNYQLHIYNRWGQLVFESTDPAQGWNGTYKNAPQPQGVYTYFSTYTLRKQKQTEGTLTLFR